jgi:hypothetical protein
MTSKAIAAAVISLSCALTASAQAQTPYNSGATSRSEIVGALLGALFGAPATATQTLETGWNRGGRPLSERRTSLEARLDAGLRNGSLTRREADQLRDEYNEIVQIESNYAADGRFTAQERSDLTYRYENLSRGVREEAQDDDNGSRPWRPLEDRRANFDTRLGAALEDRSINRTEAARLRLDFQALVQLEARYSRNGLDDREIADLRARYQELRARVGDSGVGQEDRWAGIERRIAQGQRSGAINAQEAARLRSELGDLVRLEAAYASGGMAADERDYLDRRFSEVNGRLAGWR